MVDDEAFAAFQAHVDQLAREAGVDLDNDDRRQILGQSIADGFTPDATVEAFSAHMAIDEPITWDDDEPTAEQPEPDIDRLSQTVAADHERLQQKIGRPLLKSEFEAVARAALEDTQAGRPVDLEAAVDRHWGGKAPDMGDSNDRVEWMTRALAERTPRELDDPEREYDLDNADDRVAYMTARANGEEFEEAPEPRDLSWLDDNELPPAA